MRLSRLAALAAAPLALAALVSLTPAPASAGVQFNALVENALTDNAPQRLATTGSPLAELDGVRVEAVRLPDAAQ